jgi:glycosyltransferase involved in cell wall biosynthesis
VGRLAPEKGLDTLLDAWPAVVAAFPKARLTLIGEGPERPSLKARVSRLGLADAVELPGATDDPTRALRAADLFVLPSREEGMSIALLEAMALGLPLVATSIPGNRRLVQDFKHGRLVPPDDPAAFARAVIDQWSNFDRAFHMSRTARRRVQDEFSIRAVARKHLELFRKLVSERSS